MKQVFIDVETTGVNHWQHSVHQISGGVYIDNELKESFDFKIKPHEKGKIEDEALAIGGLKLEDVMAYPHRSESYAQLTKILSKYVKKFDRQDKFFFCAYNAHFDNAFVRAFFKQCGDNYFGSYFWSNNIDVMVLAAEYLKNERASMPNFKLMTVAKHLGIEIEEEKAHDGFYDIEITKKVYDIVIGKR
jgi:DNA polymerase-3 subunit epsilon